MCVGSVCWLVPAANWANRAVAEYVIFAMLRPRVLRIGCITLRQLPWTLWKLVCVYLCVCGVCVRVRVSVCVCVDGCVGHLVFPRGRSALRCTGYRSQTVIMCETARLATLARGILEAVIWPT